MLPKVILVLKLRNLDFITYAHVTVHDKHIMTNMAAEWEQKVSPECIPPCTSRVPHIPLLTHFKMMVTGDSFLSQAVSNDKQGVEIWEVFFFSSLVHHYVLTLSICPSLCQRACVVRKEDEICSLRNILSD